MSTRKKAMGRGLDALFESNSIEQTGGVSVLSINDIETNKNQPRKIFDESAIAELAESIKTHGVIQPIMVRKAGRGYEIVAGERRYRASRMAGLTEIPAIVRELDDSQTMQLALIENLQRQDLSPMEEAQGYRTLMDSYGFSQEEVARTVGKSRSAVANTLRLLGLPEEIKPFLEEGRLSAGHARALLGLNDPKDIEAAAMKIVDESLSVRQAESLVKKLNSDAKKPEKEKPQKLSRYAEVELALNQVLGTKVKIKDNKSDTGGELIIEFYDAPELYAIANKIEKIWNAPMDN